MHDLVMTGFVVSTALHMLLAEKAGKSACPQEGLRQKLEYCKKSVRLTTTKIQKCTPWTTLTQQNASKDKQQKNWQTDQRDTWNLDNMGS